MLGMLGFRLMYRKLYESIMMVKSISGYSFSFSLRARYMPQEPMILATKAINGDVNIFDVRRHPSTPRDSVCRPNYILKGHTKEGYGLAWSSLQRGYLGSGADDGKVLVWSLSSLSTFTSTPLLEYNEQQCVVEVSCRVSFLR